MVVHIGVCHSVVAITGVGIAKHVVGIEVNRVGYECFVGSYERLVGGSEVTVFTTVFKIEVCMHICTQIITCQT